LSKLAEFLKSDKSQTFYVVGHTDTQGSFEHNLQLSINRAKSVVTALVETHNIPVNQLVAKGVGPLSPKASNQNAAGREKNRRVELVLSQ